MRPGVDNPIPLVARVECRSESRSEEQPVAVVIGGVRHPVSAVVDDTVVGSGLAGGPVRRRVRVELADGSRLDLERVLPDGEWRVWRVGGHVER